MCQELSDPSPPKIDITGASGDAVFGNMAQYKIENAYDGLAENCYIPGTNRNSKAQFEIPESNVHAVRIMNRRDCCGE